MRKLSIVFAFFTLLIVSTVAQEPATVHFYRYRQYVGSALRPSVYCDGVQLGRIENGRFLDVKMPAGSHTFYAEDKQAGAVVDVEPGKEYFFRTDLQTGFWKGHFRLTMVMPEQGKFDLVKLKPSESTENKHELPAKGASREPAVVPPASNVPETNKIPAPVTPSATQIPN